MVPELTKGFGLTIATDGHEIVYHKEESRGMRFAEFAHATSRNGGQYWLSSGGLYALSFIIPVTDWAGEWQLLHLVPIYIFMDGI